MAQDFIGTNKHGMRQVISQKAKSGGRKCLVPWRKVAGGMKFKKVFPDKAAAEKFAAKKDPTLVAYRCRRHGGWHLGHNYGNATEG